MSANISSMRGPSWEKITDTALQNKNLNADIRVSSDAVQVNAPTYWQKFKVMIGLEKDPVYASRKETLENLNNKFTLDFLANLHTLLQETGIKKGSREYNELIQQAHQSRHDITQELTKAIETPSVSTSQGIQEVRLDSLNSLYLLRKQFAQPQQTPQICVTKEGQISVLQPAPQPENLVLSGGGVKGIGYVGWLNAAKRAGALDKLKRVAGSSAGAITAALIAAGLNADEFDQASKRMSFFRMLTGTSRDPVVIQNTPLEPATFFSSFTGTYAVEYVNQEMIGSIKQYFNSLSSGELEKKIIDPALHLRTEEQKILLNLEQTIEPPPRLSFFKLLFSTKQPERPTHMVTFKELDLLTKLDPRFKELTVTAYNGSTKKEIYYNAKNSPDQAIAVAVRASMSLPLFFQPIVDNKTNDVVADGGMGSNTPVEVFVQNGAGEEELEQARAKTVVLKLDTNGRCYDIISRGIIHAKVSWVAALLSSNPNFQESSDWDAQKLYDSGVNAMNVYHGNLGLISVTANQESLDEAKQQAEIRAMEAFSLRQNQAINHLFPSLKEAMQAMTSSELQDITVFYEGSDDIVKAAERELANRSTAALTHSV